MVVCQTLPYELFALVRDLRLHGERNFAGVEDGLVFEDGLLRLVVAKGLLAEQELEEDDAHRPDVDLVRNLRAVLLETLGRLVPISAYALRSQLDLLVAFVYYLAQPEVCYLYFAVVEYYVLRLQIVMNYLLFAVVQVLQA